MSWNNQTYSQRLSALNISILYAIKLENENPKIFH